MDSFKRRVSSVAAPRQSSTSHAADADLAKLGYKSELPRSLSMLSILGMSFAIMAVPFGLSTTFYITLRDGQSVTVLWGWVLVSLISLSIAASLAEICAVYPTAGGVYYWSAMLATPKWAPIASWITGWFNLVGNWTVTLSIIFSGAQLILSAISLWRPGFAANAWQTVLCFWALMLVCFLINVFGAKYLDIINKICIYWTAASVVIIIVTVLAMADTRRSGEYVFAHYDASLSGWPSGWAFFVGLLQGAYVLTGYGLVASLCDECCYPAREVPKAMVLSVAAAGVTGVVYLIPILFVLPDVQTLLDVPSGQPIGLLFQTVTGSAAGGFGLLFLILGILLFAGTGALTASSRCTWAFARDGAVPASRWLAKTNSKLGIPLNGLIASTIVDCLLGLIYFGSTAAFNSFTGVATICLSCGYGLPILVSVLRGRKMVQQSSFSLGRFGFAINIICLLWISLAIVLFCMPVSIPVTPSTMNYASVVFAGFAAISMLWYFVRGRKDFSGPPVLQDTNPAIEGRPLDGEGELKTWTSLDNGESRSHATTVAANKGY
nr:amino-acid permease bat1 [Quercus suber]